MKRILTFVPNYFPGYMSGGIARTIFNTADWLGTEFKFLIATRDRDLGSDTEYPDIRLGVWNPMGHAEVRYLAPPELSLERLAAFINATEHDILHLNSFFDPVFTIRLLLLLRLKKIAPRTVLLSPRGEFVAGPLALKYAKKKVYIELSKLLGFYRGVTWHASSPHEASGMLDAIRLPVESVKVAIDLPVQHTLRGTPTAPAGNADGDHLKIVFISRMTREKNLDGALRILRDVKSRVVFDIIGPREDKRYWAECEALMKTLPSNVQAAYKGSIPPDQVFDTLSRYDLFLFPSHGENYGHVIAESISVGTRVLVSQFTPWRELHSDGLGWDLDLAHPERFAEVIDRLALESPTARQTARQRAGRSAATRLANPAALEENRLLFASI